MRVLLLLALATLLASPALAQLDPDVRIVTIVNADSVVGEVVDGERLRRLFGRVHLRQDSTDLRSDRATQYLDRDRILFEGRVSIANPGDTLTARRVSYETGLRIGRATGAVRLADAEAELFSDSLTYFRTERRAVFDTPVRLVEREGGATLTSRRGTYFTERKEAFFQGDVRLVDSTSVLTSQSGRYGVEDKRADFTGDVRLTHDRSTRLAADSLTHFRDTERSEARGRVALLRLGDDEDTAEPDTTRRNLLFGGFVFHDEPARYSRVERGSDRYDPLLVRLQTDSLGVTDSLLVRARLFEAFQFDAARPDTIAPLPPGMRLQRFLARGDAHLADDRLAALADSVVVERWRVAEGTEDMGIGTGDSGIGMGDSGIGMGDGAEQNDGGQTTEDGGRRTDDRGQTTEDGGRRTDDRGQTTEDRGEESIEPVEPTEVGEAEDVEAEDGDSVSGMGETVAPMPPSPQPRAPSPLDEVRLYRTPIAWLTPRGSSVVTQLTGDQMRARGQDEAIDSLFVDGRAFAVRPDSALGRLNQTRGRQMLALIRDDTLRAVRVWPNAEAVLFRADSLDRLEGAVRVSADSLSLLFEGDTLRRVGVYRGVEGDYLDAPLVPENLALDGLNYQPERRPTRAALLEGRPPLDDPFQRPPPRLDPPALAPLPDPAELFPIPDTGVPDAPEPDAPELETPEIEPAEVGSGEPDDDQPSLEPVEEDASRSPVPIP